MVYPPGFGHHHHHDGDDSLIVDFDGNVDDDDDLGVTLVYKDTKRNMDFVGDFKETRNIYLNFLKDFLKVFFCYLIMVKITCFIQSFTFS